MNQDRKKAAVARAAIDHVAEGVVLGVGTGSTVDFFIDELAASGRRIAAAVSSSERSTERLAGHDFERFDLRDAEWSSKFLDWVGRNRAALPAISP